MKIKQTFRIVYRDPMLDVLREDEKTFEGDSRGQFSPRYWAEDWAYTLADKGWYEITRIDIPKKSGKM